MAYEYELLSDVVQVSNTHCLQSINLCDSKINTVLQQLKAYLNTFKPGHMWLSSAALVWSEPDRDVKVSDMSIFLTSIKPISSLAMISSDDLLLLLFVYAGDRGGAVG